jgi:hypothetical protein
MMLASSLLIPVIITVFALSDISLEGLKALDFFISLPKKKLLSDAFQLYGWNALTTVPIELANMLSKDSLLSARQSSTSATQKLVIIVAR